MTLGTDRWFRCAVPVLPLPFLFPIREREPQEITESHTTAYTLNIQNVVVVRSNLTHPRHASVSCIAARPVQTLHHPQSFKPLPANLPSRSCHLNFKPPFRVKITLALLTAEPRWLSRVSVCELQTRRRIGDFSWMLITSGRRLVREGCSSGIPWCKKGVVVSESGDGTELTG
jgi:hypothetical protein